MLLPLLPIDCANSYGCHLAIFALGHPSYWGSKEKALYVFAWWYSEVFTEVRIKIGQIAAFEIKGTTVFFGDIFGIDESCQGREYLGGG